MRSNERTNERFSQKQVRHTVLARRTTDDDYQFEGFESPNTTPVPDVVFDRLLARLGEAELKSLLYIIRRTFGFKKERDPISFNQFLKGIVTQDGRVLDEGCGVRDRTTLSKALKSLEAKGIVLSEKGTDERGENITTVYKLRFRDAAMESSDGVVGNSYHRSMEPPPPVVGNSYPQKTVKQKTVVNDSNIRKPPRDSEFRSVAPTESSLTGGASADVLPSAETGEPTPPAGIRRGGSPSPRVSRPRAGRYQDQDYQTIQSYLADFARELNDRAPLKSSTTRAFNLYLRSGLDLDGFIAQLYAARAIVKEQAAAILSTSTPNAAGFPVSHRAGYYFAVLADLLGLRTDEDGQSGSPDRSSAG